MRLIHCIVIREKPPSKRPRKQSNLFCVCVLYSLNNNRIRGVLNVQGAHAIFFFFFFFETLKCARINDTSRVIRNPNILHMRKQRRRSAAL